MYKRQASLSRTESDDVLDGIQKKIELAMNNCFVQNTAAPLDSLFTKLNKLEDGNGMVPYWKAYITYYKSVLDVYKRQVYNITREILDGLNARYSSPVKK